MFEGEKIAKINIFIFTDLSDSVGDLGLDKSRVVGADGSDHVDPGSTADSWDSQDILQIFVGHNLAY